jgi:23S rRNA pseudouridine2605 synthase
MGRNRIVRRMFEALGYEVLKLDRVMFAGLTKKDLQRGHWRHLSEKEVTWLKQMKEAPKSSKEERSGRRTRLSQGSE